MFLWKDHAVTLAVRDGQLRGSIVIMKKAVLIESGDESGYRKGLVGNNTPHRQTFLTVCEPVAIAVSRPAQNVTEQGLERHGE